MAIDIPARDGKIDNLFLQCIVSLLARGMSPSWPEDFILSLRGQNSIQCPYWPGLHEVYLLDKFTARQDYTLSPRGQDGIKRPYWPGLRQVYLSEKFTARQDYTLSPRGQNCIQRPCWPGQHEVYLLDKFTARQDYILSHSMSEEDILYSLLKIESQKPKSLLSGQDCI